MVPQRSLEEHLGLRVLLLSLVPSWRKGPGSHFYVVTPPQVPFSKDSADTLKPKCQSEAEVRRDALPWYGGCCGGPLLNQRNHTSQTQPLLMNSTWDKKSQIGRAG